MNVSAKIGDVVDCSGDVLVCPANPWLNMSGGVNGEILLRCGTEIQTELHGHLKLLQAKHVEPTTVVVTSASTLDYKQIVHAVAIDAFYDTNKTVVEATLVAAWAIASKIGNTVVMPALATGYGRLSFVDFFAAFRAALDRSRSLNIQLLLVLRHAEQLRQFGNCSMKL